MVFPWTSIDDVLSSISKNIEALDKLAEKHTEQAAEADVQAKLYQDIGRKHHDDAQRAKRVSGKFTELIS